MILFTASVTVGDDDDGDDRTFDSHPLLAGLGQRTSTLCCSAPRERTIGHCWGFIVVTLFIWT